MTPFAPPLDAESLRAMYPERDGNPMSDNMTQGRWIHLLFGNLCALLADRDDAFVASDNLWYPLEGRPDERLAPDVYVVFGRPKGDRGSYMPWLEDGVPITVVFEILSPRNTKEEMAKKLLFYDHYGAEEYYVYDPDRKTPGLHTRQSDPAATSRHRHVRQPAPGHPLRDDPARDDRLRTRRRTVPHLRGAEASRHAPRRTEPQSPARPSDT